MYTFYCITLSMIAVMISTITVGMYKKVHPYGYVGNASCAVLVQRVPVVIIDIYEKRKRSSKKQQGHVHYNRIVCRQ